MKGYISLLVGIVVLGISLLFLFSCVQNEIDFADNVPKTQNYFVKIYVSSIINDTFEQALKDFTKKTPKDIVNEFKNLLKSRLSKRVKGNFSEEFDKKTRFTCEGDDCCLEILEDFESYFEFKGKKYPVFKKGDKFCLGFNINTLGEVLIKIDNLINELNNSVLEYGATTKGWGCNFESFGVVNIHNYYSECDNDCIESCKKMFEDKLENEIKSIVSVLPITFQVEYDIDSKSYKIPIYYCFDTQLVNINVEKVNKKFGRVICFKSKYKSTIYQEYYSKITMRFKLKYKVGGTYYEVSFERVSEPKPPKEIKIEDNFVEINDSWYRSNLGYEDIKVADSSCVLSSKCSFKKADCMRGKNLECKVNRISNKYYGEGYCYTNSCCGKKCRCCGFITFYSHVEIIPKAEGDNILGLYYKEQINKRKTPPRYIIHDRISTKNFCSLYGKTTKTDIKCENEGIAEVPFKYFTKGTGYIHFIKNLNIDNFDIIFFGQ